MKDITNALLKKVKASISVRDSNYDAYVESFRQAETFITATIKGELEFVPLQLLFLNNNKYQILMEVKAVFGNGTEHRQLDDLLIKFYNDHNLKRDIDSISDSVRYHIKPQDQVPSSSDGLFDWSQIESLASSAGKAYKANDPTLKEIGQRFAEQIMHPTNIWGESVLPDGYMMERERYWQVAGKYKSFTWAKIKHKKYIEEQIFFSVGVDISAGRLVFKLDCLRSGTHKLSNFDIRKFDYYTENFNCYTEINQTLGEAIGWNSILEMSREFINDFESVYLGVVEYIWNGKIDVSQFSNKVFNIPAENAKFSSNESGEQLPELLYNSVLDSVVTYEQYMLSHADKDDLAALVKFSFDKITQIDSFEFDGQHKQIYVVAGTGGPSTPFEISEDLRQLLMASDHVYIYQVYDYDQAANSCKMVMRKGDPKQYAKLESKLYAATVK